MQRLRLTDYPAPAGGCLLTEPNYSYRLKELLDHDPDPALNDLHLLRLGRHFRLSPECKAIAGRNEEENSRIEAFAGRGSFLMRVEDVGSPTLLLSGEVSDELIHHAATICARYSDAKHLPEVEVRVERQDNFYRLLVRPADNAFIETYRIENRKTSDRGKNKGHALLKA